MEGVVCVKRLDDLIMFSFHNKKSGCQDKFGKYVFNLNECVFVLHHVDRSFCFMSFFSMDFLHHFGIDSLMFFTASLFFLFCS